MDREYDEVISDILIQLAAIEINNDVEHERLNSLTKRIDLTVKRMVKVESRMEELERQFNLMIQTQKRFIEEQNRINKEFSDFIKRK